MVLMSTSLCVPLKDFLCFTTPLKHGGIERTGASMFPLKVAGIRDVGGFCVWATTLLIRSTFLREGGWLYCLCLSAYIASLLGYL